MTTEQRGWPADTPLPDPVAQSIPRRSYGAKLKDLARQVEEQGDQLNALSKALCIQTAVVKIECWVVGAFCSALICWAAFG